MIGIIKSLILSYWSEENRKDKRSVGGIKAHRFHQKTQRKLDVAY